MEATVPTDVDVFKAFSDETRLRVLFLIARRELCVCELVAVLDLPQGRISRHLAMLRSAGLVSVRRDGTWIYYSLARPDSALVERLHDYLARDVRTLPVVAEDGRRLLRLARTGRICVPNPAYVPASNRN